MSVVNAFVTVGRPGRIIYTRGSGVFGGGTGAPRPSGRGKTTDEKAAGRNKKKNRNRQKRMMSPHRRRPSLSRPYGAVTQPSRRVVVVPSRSPETIVRGATYGHADGFGQSKNGRRLIQVLGSRTRLPRPTGPPGPRSSFDALQRTANRPIRLYGS